jgi:predicted ATP-grasp superfamily ATP-dependent carboligase
VEALARACAHEGADYVLPAHDDVVVPLIEHARELGVEVLAPPLEAARTARSKRATYRALAGVVRVPRVHAGTIPAEAFPVFCKPDSSQGSRGAARADDAPEVERLRAAGSDLVAEYLPGAEYTIDCLSADGGRLMFAGPRERERTRAGISMRSTPVEAPALVAMARAVSERLGMRGAWFAQARLAGDGAPVLIEVGARLAGTSGVQRARGVNLPLLAMYEREGHALEVAPLPIAVTLERALVNRFATDVDVSRVYVDLDDTLIVRGEPDADLIRLLYQQVAAGREVVLLTRHAEDVRRTLRAHRIAEGLFDAIVRVAPHEPKVRHMEPAPALLIDDSHAERTEAIAAGHLALDPSSADLLADDRR